MQTRPTRTFLCDCRPAAFALNKLIVLEKCACIHVMCSLYQGLHLASDVLLGNCQCKATSRVVFSDHLPVSAIQHHILLLIRVNNCDKSPRLIKKNLSTCGWVDMLFINPTTSKETPTHRCVTMNVKCSQRLWCNYTTESCIVLAHKQ